jgi:hypothetical protein
MDPRIPQPPELLATEPPRTGRPAPGTIRATLAGAAPDLTRFAIFLQAVTDGHAPGGVLVDLRLAGITIVAMRGRRATHMVVTFRLDELPAPGE